MKVLDTATGNLLRAVVQPPSAVRAMAELMSEITSWEATIERPAAWDPAHVA
jgi:hypothetical protein